KMRTAMASSLLNGERAVVVLFISPILVATPFSLLSESCFLFLLTLFALFLEIFAESSNSLDQFKIRHAFPSILALYPFKSRFTVRVSRLRPGASSGILLGTVTLPGLMISKLIQLSRVLSLQQTGFEGLGNPYSVCLILPLELRFVGKTKVFNLSFPSTELEYLRLQYWAASACCFSVLVFLGFVLRPQSSSIHPVAAHGYWGVKISISCIALYAAACFVDFATKSHFGWSLALKLLWLLCQGFAAVRLIQHVLHTFPYCASIVFVIYLFLGEALLVTSGLVLYFGDMFTLTYSKIHGHLTSSALLFVEYGVKRSEISIIIQGIVLGLLIFPVFFKFIIQIWERFTSPASSVESRNHHIRCSVIFYASLAFILIAITPTWIQLVGDFHLNPILWHFEVGSGTGIGSNFRVGSVAFACVP
ncbi:unnamed protein product, partial [Thlaspi arvense]